jgi:2-polyprenyl-3-methyl-5-hydroxy-6-metoxy-1,4-benzoquinol methylase
MRPQSRGKHRSSHAVQRSLGQVYTMKTTSDVSWFQEHARQSIQLIHQSGVARDADIIDVGAGASTMVDDLLDEGYSRVTVLDLSEAALTESKTRLGHRAEGVSWLVGDITRVELPRHAYDVWHDRAVFHFLTARRNGRPTFRLFCSVKPGGHVIVATFAEDGPDKCSGLPVIRYSADGLHAEFGTPFTLLQQEREEHHTPFGTVQKFIYCLCRKETN